VDTERKRIDKIIRDHLYRIYYLDDESYLLKKKTIARRIFCCEGGGICYILVFFYCLFDRSYKIARGKCYVSYDGVREREVMEHCWCENDKYVYDPTWGNELFLKEDFYKERQVRDGVVLYTFEEVMENFIKYRSLENWESYMLREHDKHYFDFEKCIHKLCEDSTKVRYFYWHRSAYKGKELTLRLRFRLPLMVE